MRSFTVCGTLCLPALSEWAYPSAKGTMRRKAHCDPIAQQACAVQQSQSKKAMRSQQQAIQPPSTQASARVNDSSSKLVVRIERCNFVALGQCRVVEDVIHKEIECAAKRHRRLANVDQL